MTEQTDQVLVLHRPGAYWTHTPTAAATLSRLTGSEPHRVVDLELEADHCRFVNR
jgi:hypothetical protein